MSLPAYDRKRAVLATSTEARLDWRAQGVAYELVREVLSGRRSRADAVATLTAPEYRDVGLQKRLLEALDDGGDGDVAALLGAVLRRQGTLDPLASPPVVEISPEVHPIERRTLEASSLTAVELEDGVLAVTARPWRPLWLGRVDVLEGVDALEDRRRAAREVGADPFFEAATGMATYSSAGQQAAARCVALSPPGSTIVASLPTGTGKTVIGLLSALTARDGTAVVVVPTVSLAADQEAELRGHLDRGGLGVRWAHRDFAYLGRSRADTKDAIRDRIREGAQGVVFCAPESLRSLSWSLAHAAREGRLTAFVVDEAHVVTGWGDDFRPEFQTMAGMRRSLVALSPPSRCPKTVLLSATLSPHDVAVARKLFDPGGLGSWFEAYELALRPEPEIWVASANSLDERDEWIVEAVCHVPRPAIVYVNRPEDAERLVGRLADAGVQRVAAYTGRTSSVDRQRVEEGWRDRHGTSSLDVVVATSAFGLGINQRDVRAVLHGSVPDGVSRYYQELGRGGRDGRAIVNILVGTPEGTHEARRLSARSYPNEVTEPRWRSMYDRRREPVPARDGVVFVDVADVRSDRAGSGSTDSDWNQTWNGLVLSLLQQADLIRLEEPLEGAPPEGMAAPVGVRLLRADTLSDEWERAWRSVRQTGQEFARRELGLLFSIIDGTRCAGEVLAEAFSGQGLRPGVTCAGCPACRRIGAPSALADPSVVVRGSSPTPLSRIVGTRRLAILPAEAHETSLRRLLASLAARFPIVLFGGNTDRLLTDVAPNDRGAIARSPSDEWVPAPIPGTIEVILALDGKVPGWAVDSPAEGVARLLIVPSDAPSPTRPERTMLNHLDLPVLTVDGLLGTLV